jgi:hypothetical protein
MGNGQSWFQVLPPLDINDPSIPIKQGQGKLQIWGPIKKTFWTPTGVGDPFFRIPNTVNGQYVHCKCANIGEFMRGTETFWSSVLSGRVIPACWEDREISTDPTTLKYHFNPYSFKNAFLKPVQSTGDDDIPTYSLYLNHPDFAAFSVSNRGMLGVPEALTKAAGFMSMFSVKSSVSGGHRKRAPSSSRRLRRPTTVRSQALNSRRRRHTR